MTTEFLLSEGLRIIALWLLNLVGLAVADRLTVSPKLTAEGGRKLIHVTAGLLAVPLPWVLRSNWSMLVLAAGGFVGLLACRRLGLLRSVHAVERSSAGDLLFPIGIALLFLVGHGQPAFYMIGLSYMVVSDALAALVGQRYGLSSFSVERQRRSVEGSLAFFFVSFLAAHLILLLATDAPRITSVLVAVQLALLVTCFEAISLKGNDNLLVPVVTCLILIRLAELPTGVLARDLIAQVSIGLAVWYANWRWRFAGVTGAMTLALFLYGAYALGGVVWLAAPVVSLATYIGLRVLFFSGRTPADTHHQVVAVFYITVVGATLYLTEATVEMLTGAVRGAGAADVFLAPYLGTVAAELGLLLYSLLRPWNAPVEALDPGLMPALGAAVLIAPFSLLAPGGVYTALLWIFAAPLLSGWLYRRVRNGSSWPRAVPWNYRLQMVAVVTALVLVAPFHVGLIG